MHISSFCKAAYLFSFIVCLITSCSEKDNNDLSLHTDIHSLVSTPLENHLWKDGDTIGVFLLKPSKVENDLNSNIVAATNKAFKTNGNGVFTTTDKNFHLYQTKGTKLVAYYPYQKETINGMVEVNIKDQDRLKYYPLLLADNLNEHTEWGTQPCLKFQTPLTRVNFKIKSNTLNISQWRIALCNVPTRASLDIKSGDILPDYSDRDTIALTFEEGSMERHGTAWIFPSANATLKLRFITENNDTLYHTVVQQTSFISGHTYNYSFIPTNEGDNNNDESVYKGGNYTETPAIPNGWLLKKNIRFIQHHFNYKNRRYRNYEMLYDTDLNIAYWVSYPLCRFYTTHNVGRTNHWAFDPAIPQYLQPNMENYIRKYDRGHQIPSADRLVCEEANFQTFYYTNMTPQTKWLNQKGWAYLENRVRGFSENVDTLFVVTGAIPSAHNWTISNADRARINVPTDYYKALCHINGDGSATTIAFLYPHQGVPENHDIFQYALSVADLEKVTGFTFFPKISPIYKLQYDRKLWY